MPEDDVVHMKLDKQTSDLLLKCDTTGEFREAIQESDGGQRTVKLEKALYGCVQPAKLWYNHLSNFLQGIGFKPNPVDPCVFNRMSSTGKQCTLAMHVDDGLATCVDVEELRKLDQGVHSQDGKGGHIVSDANYLIRLCIIFPAFTDVNCEWCILVTIMIYPTGHSEEHRSSGGNAALQFIRICH